MNCEGHSPGQIHICVLGVCLHSWTSTVNFLLLYSSQKIIGGSLVILAVVIKDEYVYMFCHRALSGFILAKESYLLPSDFINIRSS